MSQNHVNMLKDLESYEYVKIMLTSLMGYNRINKLFVSIYIQVNLIHLFNRLNESCVVTM